MRKILFILLFSLICSAVYADIITMPQYGPTSTLTNVNLNNRWNLLTNEMNGNLDNNNADVDDGFRFIEVLPSLPAPGNQGRVVFLTSNNTLNHDTGTAWLATAILSNDQTFTGANTFSGTVTLNGAVDLNAKLTADANEIEGSNFDINGGTIDSVDVAGAANQGDIWYDNGSTITRLTPGSDGQFLETNGAAANPSWENLVGAGLFTGSGTFTAPPAITKVYINLCAGGGGGGQGDGGGGGGGGGAGECLINFPFTVTPGNTYTVTIGGGGAGGTGGGVDGSDGVDTSFDSVTVDKGLGGKSSANGGAGGVGGGNASLDGGDAGVGVGTAGTISFKGGDGGDNGGNGGGGGGATQLAGSGAAGGVAATANTGGGGGGGAQGGGNPAGSAGASGICFVIY